MSHLRQVWAGVIERTAIGPNTTLYRAVRTTIPWDDRKPEDKNITAREIWERAKRAMATGEGGRYGDHYTPERPGSWWWMDSEDSFKFDGAKYWAGSFAGYSGPRGDQAGVGIIYEARLAEKPPYPYKVPGGSMFVPGIKLNIVAVHVTMPDGSFAKVPVNIRAVTG